MQKGIKQAELAAYLNVGQNTLSNWENGVYEPDLNNLIKLADYFNTNIDYILSRTNDAAPIDAKRLTANEVEEILAKLEKSRSAETERNKNIIVLKSKIDQLKALDENSLDKVKEYIDLLIYRHSN